MTPRLLITQTQKRRRRRAPTYYNVSADRGDDRLVRQEFGGDEFRKAYDWALAWMDKHPPLWGPARLSLPFVRIDHFDGEELHTMDRWAGATGRWDQGLRENPMKTANDCGCSKPNPISSGTALGVGVVAALVLGVGATLYAVFSSKPAAASGPPSPAHDSCMWTELTEGIKLATGPVSYRVELVAQAKSEEAQKMMALLSNDLGKAAQALSQEIPGLKIIGLWIDSATSHASYPANTQAPWRGATESGDYILRAEVYSPTDVRNILNGEGDLKTGSLKGDVQIKSVKTWFCSLVVS